MEGGGGGGRAAPSGVDRLSALPDDALVRILLHLDTAAAVRTSVLSRRWRGVWTLLPELRFGFFPHPHPVASALVAHKAALSLVVEADPESLAACLPIAASRPSGRFKFRIRANEDDESNTVELPCFEHATSVTLQMRLGLCSLALPSTGVFARLTELCLFDLPISGQCKLGDAVSTPRCPCLQKLVVTCPDGLDEITIRSKSLLQINLEGFHDLQQLTVVAPALMELTVTHFNFTKDPSPVHLCEIEHLGSLTTSIYPYGIDGLVDNRASSMLLQHFKALECLYLTIYYLPDIKFLQYLMEDIRVLPQTTLLSVNLFSEKHAFGASLFHLLKISSGVRRLQLDLGPSNMEAQETCPTGCACDAPADWKTEELALNGLQSIVISEMKGADHEVAFVQQLFNWTMAPIEITFSCSVSKSKARMLRRTLSTCKPGTRLKCYIFHNEEKKMRCLLGPED